MNKQRNKKQKQTPINIKNKLVVARGAWGGVLGKMGEGEWQIQTSSS